MQNISASLPVCTHLLHPPVLVFRFVVSSFDGCMCSDLRPRVRPHGRRRRPSRTDNRNRQRHTQTDTDDETRRGRQEHDDQCTTELRLSFFARCRGFCAVVWCAPSHCWRRCSSCRPRPLRASCSRQQESRIRSTSRCNCWHYLPLTVSRRCDQRRELATLRVRESWALELAHSASPTEPTLS